MEVLLAIKPEFVEKIFSGEKKYEFRKVVFKKEVRQGSNLCQQSYFESCWRV